MLKWIFADRYKDLPSDKAMLIEVLIQIAQQLADIKEQMERLNKQYKDVNKPRP